MAKKKCTDCPKPPADYAEPIKDKSDLDRYSYTKLFAAIVNKFCKQVAGLFGFK